MLLLRWGGIGDDAEPVIGIGKESWSQGRRESGRRSVEGCIDGSEGRLMDQPRL